MGNVGSGIRLWEGGGDLSFLWKNTSGGGGGGGGEGDGGGNPEDWQKFWQPILDRSTATQQVATIKVLQEAAAKANTQKKATPSAGWDKFLSDRLAVAQSKAAQEARAQQEAAAAALRAADEAKRLKARQDADALRASQEAARRAAAEQQQRAAAEQQRLADQRAAAEQRAHDEHQLREEQRVIQQQQAAQLAAQKVAKSVAEHDEREVRAGSAIQCEIENACQAGNIAEVTRLKKQQEYYIQRRLGEALQRRAVLRLSRDLPFQAGEQYLLEEYRSIVMREQRLAVEHDLAEQQRADASTVIEAGVIQHRIIQALRVFNFAEASRLENLLAAGEARLVEAIQRRAILRQSKHLPLIFGEEPFLLDELRLAEQRRQVICEQHNSQGLQFYRSLPQKSICIEGELAAQTESLSTNPLDSQDTLSTPMQAAQQAAAQQEAAAEAQQEADGQLVISAVALNYLMKKARLAGDVAEVAQLENCIMAGKERLDQALERRMLLRRSKQLPYLNGEVRFIDQHLARSVVQEIEQRVGQPLPVRIIQALDGCSFAELHLFKEHYRDTGYVEVRYTGRLARLIEAQRLVDEQAAEGGLSINPDLSAHQNSTKSESDPAEAFETFQSAIISPETLQFMLQYCFKELRSGNESIRDSKTPEECLFLYCIAVVSAIHGPRGDANPRASEGELALASVQGFFAAPSRRKFVYARMAQLFGEGGSQPTVYSDRPNVALDLNNPALKIVEEALACYRDIAPTSESQHDFFTGAPEVGDGDMVSAEGAKLLKDGLDAFEAGASSIDLRNLPRNILDQIVANWRAFNEQANTQSMMSA